MNHFVVYLFTFFWSLINLGHCIDPKLSFRMLVSDDATNLGIDKNYQNDDLTVRKSLDCKFDEKIYQNGNQWKSSNNSCELCHCDKGVKICDIQQCPSLSCKKQIRLKDECCPIYTFSPNNLSENEKVGCTLSEGVSYKAGSIWHPFIVPFGFDKCTVCTCLVNKMDCENICKRRSSKKSRSLKRNNFRKLMRRNFIFLRSN